jgi:hypothetical protein
MSAILNLMPPATGLVDTSTSRDLAVSGQLANAGRTIALESCLMELACGARPFTRRRA